LRQFPEVYSLFGLDVFYWRVVNPQAILPRPYVIPKQEKNANKHAVVWNAQIRQMGGVFQDGMTGNGLTGWVITVM
jgi:hypothetical protein